MKNSKYTNTNRNINLVKSNNLQLTYNLDNNNNNNDNNLFKYSLNLPYESEFTKGKYFTQCINSMNTSNSGIGTNENNYKMSEILDCYAFKSELRKRELQKKNEKNNTIKTHTYLNRPSVDNLLSENSKLKEEIQQLKDEINTLKHENFVYESENTNIKRYKEIIDKDFELWSFLSKCIKDQRCKLKGQVDYYILNKKEHLFLIDSYKKALKNLLNVHIKDRLIENQNKATECQGEEKEEKEKSLDIKELENLSISQEQDEKNYSYPKNSESDLSHKYNQSYQSMYQEEQKSYIPLKNVFKRPSSKNIHNNQNDNSEDYTSRARSKTPEKKEYLYDNNNLYEKRIKQNQEDNQNIRLFKKKEKFPFDKGNCFACNVGCNISNAGYSPMTYSPYESNRIRQAITPIINRGNDNYKE